MNTSDRNRVIASNIKKYIKEKGITQKELANAIDISPSTLSDYMNLRSNPSHGVIQKIADYFGILKSDIDTTYKDSNDITYIYNQLNNQRQNEVVAFAKFKLQEQNKEDEKKSKESNIKKFHPAKNNAEDETTEADDPFEVFAAHIDDDATEEEMEEIIAYLKEIKKGKK